ncbi:serine/arginine repetitive matrix protein 1-like [Manduca sexta]|uniref:serine/arginine repetitive matrix protein 1-like n=1 Tax=Manduca sexta TaxID=7130 RepID=UPI00188F0C92|nr:serine/arginine repetitive matrix protein 1-like [Manduca sexta]
MSICHEDTGGRLLVEVSPESSVFGGAGGTLRQGIGLSPVEAEVGGRKPNDGDEVEKSMGDGLMVVEAGTSSRPEELEMDSESSLSVSSVRSRRLWRRHSQSIDNCSLLSSDTDEPPPKAPTTDGRGRGRSTPAPTTEKYVGIKKAQQERDRLKREEARKRAEEELEERLRYVKSPLPPRTDTDDDLPVLKEDLIHNQSRPPLPVWKRRKKWRENSERLEESVKRLEEENSSLRRRLEDLEASNNSRTTTEEMLAMVEGGTVGGPQPKTKKEKGKGKGKKTASAHPTPAPVAGPSSAPLQDIAGPSTAAAGSPAQPATKRKQAKTAPNNKTASGPKPQKGVKKTAPPPPEPRPLPPAPASMEAPWTEVVNRKKNKTSATRTPAPRQPAKRPEPKLRPPKQAQAEIRGNGAMLYEVPGAESEQKADALAARLRECFATEDVIVSRPTKCSELRISGLDFAATSETVQAALCNAGECAAESIKVGQIRPDRSGMGAVWAKVPTRAAKKIKAARVKIGWVVARVTVLEARPMRCYRCLEQGHVRNVCDCPQTTADYAIAAESRDTRPGSAKTPNCTLCAAKGANLPGIGWGGRRVLPPPPANHGVAHVGDRLPLRFCPSRRRRTHNKCIPAGEAEVGGCKPNDDEVQESAAERPMEVAAEFKVLTA